MSLENNKPVIETAMSPEGFSKLEADLHEMFNANVDTDFFIKSNITSFDEMIQNPALSDSPEIKAYVAAKNQEQARGVNLEVSSGPENGEFKQEVVENVTRELANPETLKSVETALELDAEAQKFKATVDDMVEKMKARQIALKTNPITGEPVKTTTEFEQLQETVGHLVDKNLTKTSKYAKMTVGAAAGLLAAHLFGEATIGIGLDDIAHDPSLIKYFAARFARGMHLGDGENITESALNRSAAGLAEVVAATGAVITGFCSMYKFAKGKLNQRVANNVALKRVLGYIGGGNDADKALGIVQSEMDHYEELPIFNNEDERKIIDINGGDEKYDKEPGRGVRYEVDNKNGWYDTAKVRGLRRLMKKAGFGIQGDTFKSLRS